MSDIDASNALRNYDIAGIKNSIGFFESLFRLKKIKEEGAIPAEVLEYDSKNGIVKARPLVDFTCDTSEGEKKLPRDPVTVPVIRTCHGGYSISIPVYNGDKGWIVAGDRRWDSAKKKNSEVLDKNLTKEELEDRIEVPDDASLRSFANGFFIPDSWDNESSGGNSLVIRNNTDDKGNKCFDNKFGVNNTYPWSMIEIQKDGMINLYGQGKKFTVRKEGLYLDDKPFTGGGGDVTLYSGPDSNFRFVKTQRGIQCDVYYV